MAFPIERFMGADLGHLMIGASNKIGGLNSGRPEGAARGLCALLLMLRSWQSTQLFEPPPKRCRYHLKTSTSDEVGLCESAECNLLNISRYFMLF